MLKMESQCVLHGLHAVSCISIRTRASLHDPHQRSHAAVSAKWRRRGGWKKCQSTTIGENVPSLTLVLLVGTTNVGGASAAVGSSNRAQRPLAAVLVCNLTEFVFRLRL